MKSIEGFQAAAKQKETQQLQEGDKIDVTKPNGKKIDKNGNSVRDLTSAKNNKDSTQETAKSDLKNGVKSIIPEVLQKMGEDAELASLLKLPSGATKEQFMARMKDLAERSDQEPTSKDGGDSSGGFVQSIALGISELGASLNTAQNNLNERLKNKEISEKMYTNFTSRISASSQQIDFLKKDLLKVENSKNETQNYA